MRIACPCCGERAIDEYAYYGDASVVRPDIASPTAMQDFVAYTFERVNAPGPHRELWYHAAGCHLWLVVTRNVSTHEILSVETAREVALARASNPEATIKGSAC